jgi:hypothetical protein
LVTLFYHPLHQGPTGFLIILMVDHGQTGMIQSIKNANDTYVDVFVTPRFYALDIDQKKTIVLPIYAYYMTAANKTEDDIFAVRLVDSKSGHEVGKYQMGMLTIN